MVIQLTAVLMALASFSGAQSDMTAEQYYRTFLVGEYTEGARCALDAPRWEFHSRRITADDLACEIHDIAYARGPVELSTRDCTRRGKKREPVKIKIELLSADALKVNDGGRQVLLARCLVP